MFGCLHCGNGIKMQTRCLERWKVGSQSFTKYSSLLCENTFFTVSNLTFALFIPQQIVWECKHQTKLRKHTHNKYLNSKSRYVYSQAGLQENVRNWFKLPKHKWQKHQFSANRHWDLHKHQHSCPPVMFMNHDKCDVLMNIFLFSWLWQWMWIQE